MKEIGGFLWPEADVEGARSIFGGAEYLDRVAHLPKNRRTAIQAGANVGVFPKRLSKLFDRVYTFEPDAQNYACLRQNVTDENVFSIRAALGSTVGSIGLEYSTENVGSHRVNGSGDIPMTTIDALGVTDCDLIWLDIEGYELEALKGAAETIARCRPIVVVEDFGLSRKYGVPVGAVIDWLVERGYRDAGRLELDVVMVPADEYPTVFVGTTLDRFSPAERAAIPAAEREAALSMLGNCLSFRLPMQELTKLRLHLLGNSDLWNGLCALAAERDMLPVLDESLKRYGLLPPGRRSSSGSGRSPASLFEEVREQHAARRIALSNHLFDAVAALNRIGIEPLLLKGAVSLWRDAPRWRQMRDIDLTVDRSHAEEAVQAFNEIGFKFDASSSPKSASPHFPPLYREGLPGWMELHVNALNTRGNDVLPSGELEHVAVPSKRGGLSAKLLPAAYDVLHGLVHNHFSHRSSSLGTINLKGLYEFSAAVNAAEADEQRRIYTRASQNARLLAALDLWVAAAARFYRFPPPSGWVIQSDADERAERALSRMARAEVVSTMSAFAEEAGFALSRVHRLTEASAGRRLLARTGVVAAALREIVLPWRDRADLHRDSAGVRKS